MQITPDILRKLNAAALNADQMAAVLDILTAVPEPSRAVAMQSADGQFEAFWKAYPEKKAKQDARKAFDRVMRSGGVTFDRIMAALDAYRNSKPHDIAYCYPATWLNKGRWDDEYGQPSRDDNGIMAAFTSVGGRYDGTTVEPRPGHRAPAHPDRTLLDFGQARDARNAR